MCEVFIQANREQIRIVYSPPFLAIYFGNKVSS